MPAAANRLELARLAYAAYAAADRAAIEALLGDELRFYSPADVGIDRDAYFERCWPNAQRLRDYRFTRLVESGDEVIVTYECTRSDGTQFRNTEVLTFDGDRIAQVEVYFGWELS